MNDRETRNQLAWDLEQWWHERATDEVMRTVPKAVEYASGIDLADIGHHLARTAGRTVDDEEAAELGVYFYTLGKMARWNAAITRGERVSDDTLFDIGIYIRMAQRIRHTGAWPGYTGSDPAYKTALREHINSMAPEAPGEDK